MKRKAEAKPGKPNLPKGATKAKGIQARRTASDAKIDAQRKALKLERYEKVAHQRRVVKDEDVGRAEEKKLEARRLASARNVLSRQKELYGTKKFTGETLGDYGIVYPVNPEYGYSYKEGRANEAMGKEDERSHHAEAHQKHLEKIRNLPSTHLRGATGGGGAERVRGLMGMGSAGGTVPKKFVIRKKDDK
jgi:hypothetical protein